MIRYALRCADGHEFEGWFRSSTLFDSMQAAGQVACTACGGVSVQKAPMAPAVPARASAPASAGSVGPVQPAPAAAPAPETVAARVERSLAELRQQVEANSDYVGMRFVQEARAMHEGRQPERAIHGEARVEEARRLIEDGVPVAPLPFRPKQRMN